MIDKFRSAMRSAGIETKAEILADGVLHRFRVEGDRSGTLNGWYVLHCDGMPAGQFGSFKLDISEKWSAKDTKTFTPEEKALFAAKMRVMRQQRDEMQAKIQGECREWCKTIFETAKDANNEHPYLKRKGVQAYGLKLLGVSLMAPVRDSTGQLHGLQFIQPDGSKKFKTGTAKQGNYFAIGRPKDNTLLLAEGYATGASLHEATGHAVAVCFDAGNLKAVAEALRKKYPEFRLIICADNDESGIGQTKADEAALAVGGVVAMPPEAGTDWNDYHLQNGPEAVKACIDQVVKFSARVIEAPEASQESLQCNTPKDEWHEPSPAGRSTIDETVERLAALPHLEYEKVRKEEAKALGVRATALDEEIRTVLKNTGLDSDLPYREIEPWLDPVDPAEILSDIAAVVRRFIVCEREISIAVALWSAMTWLMDVVHVAPLAVITAPEKRCGKSQLLTLMGRLVCRPITASSISPAALFRAIDAWEPTLLIDEVDACMKDNEELRGIINSGHTRDSAYVIRTVGDTFTPTKFSTWGAKALSGIGHVADTLMDRAIILELRRKLPHEQVDRLRYAEPGLFDTLAAKLARFAMDYSDQVRQARPYLPPSLNDRAQDNWEPLLAIAMVAGSEWLETATKTALKLSGSESDAQSIGVELLADIQEVFEEKGVDRISTADLIKALCEDEEKPWATFNRGLSIKPRQLAGRLKGYGIASKTIRTNLLQTPKGYEKKQFDEAFSRYIPSPPSVSATTPQPNMYKGSGVADLPTRCGSVADINNHRSPETKGCGVVADRIPLSGDSKRIEVIV